MTLPLASFPAAGSAAPAPASPQRHLVWGSIFAPGLLIGAALAFTGPPAHSQNDPRTHAAPGIELVETAPVGTTLDSPDLPEAWTVWIEMIDGADASLDLGFFYVSDREPSRLTQVIEAIERAASRGVRTRLLLSAGFRATVPETVARLEAIEGLELRWLDLAELGGGVLHAKYFVVDRDDAFIGSQNFDWRALEHIQELGLRVRHPDLAGEIADVFEYDWHLAVGTHVDRPVGETAGRAAARIGDATVSLHVSPGHLVPPGSSWDLPTLVALLDGAERSVRVQLLSYRVVGYDGEYWDELDAALRRAAARGIDVRLIVADWDKRPGRIEALKSLQPVPNLEVRMLTVPPSAEGHIPFARVVHAKYLVVDGASAWVGTSNWSRDYFHASRNLGLVVRGGTVPERLDSFHAANWASEYAYPVDPCTDYEPPRIGE